MQNYHRAISYRKVINNILKYYLNNISHKNNFCFFIMFPFMLYLKRNTLENEDKRFAETYLQIQMFIERNSIL